MLSHYTLLLTLGAALTLSGCAKDPSEAAPKAEVGAVKASAKANAPAEAKGDDKVVAKSAAPDSKASAKGEAPADYALSGTIGFVGSKVTGSHTGLFKTWSGTMKADPKLEALSLSFSADVASVFSDPEKRGAWNAKLDEHLKSADFFDAATHPKATFVSTAIAKDTKGPHTHKVSGDLTMRGVTRPVTFPATVTMSAEGIEAKAEFTIQRSQWGVSYKGKADDLIREGVVLKVDVKGKS